MKTKDKLKTTYRNPMWLRQQAEGGIKIREIAKMCGVQPCTIQRWACVLRVPMVHWSAHNRTYTLDETFFNNITTEVQAYALGLWAADGYIAPHGWETRLKLHIRDIDILTKLRRGMKYTGPLRVDGTNRALAICSTQLIAGLRSHGVTPRKTFVIAMPRKLSHALLLHWWRGYIEGDGSVGKQIRIVTGSKQLCADFVAWYTRMYGHAPYTRIESGKHDKYRIILNRRDAEFVHALYAGATVYMQRKYKSYLKFWLDYTYEGPRPKRGPYKAHKSKSL